MNVGSPSDQAWHNYQGAGRAAAGPDREYTAACAHARTLHTRAQHAGYGELGSVVGAVVDKARATLHGAAHALEDAVEGAAAAQGDPCEWRGLRGAAWGRVGGQWARVWARAVSQRLGGGCAQAGAWGRCVPWASAVRARCVLASDDAGQGLIEAATSRECDLALPPGWLAPLLRSMHCMPLH